MVSNIGSFLQTRQWPARARRVLAKRRASAAFPGIAPMKIRFKDEDYIHSPAFPSGQTRPRHEIPAVAFCADGGIWNNLATQGIRESSVNRGEPLLCVNASAIPKPGPTLAYSIPIIALLASLIRISRVLSRNTVQPRVQAISNDLLRRASTNTAPNRRLIH